MKKPQDQYWRMRLSELQKVMEENNFQVYVAENSEMARDIVLNKI
ncbi:MAG: lactate utilization protein, partial [Deltaproteobacteria bacterium]|nr:lactate utilization protein [Deltaproteobacteria bacterium]